MKLNQLTLVLLVTLTASIVVSAQNIVDDQILRQKMEMSEKNLTTYNYSRFAEADLLYKNASLKEDFKAHKSTEGKVDLVNQSGSWNSNLTDENSGKILTWDGYYMNGTEYWKIGKEWTKLQANNTTQIMGDLNELPGQICLCKYSDMKIVGTESLQGEEYYKLVGSPIESIDMGIIGQQLLAAYFPSPFSLPEKLKNGTLDIDSTSLMNNSSIVMTAWVSKNTSLLRKLDINSSLIITPKILGISSPDFRIESKFNESTVYNNFGSPLKIELPKQAQKAPSKKLGTDWRWAVFGSIRP